MAKLEQLRTALESAQKNGGALLDITGNTFPAALGEVKDFFAAVLSASSLSVEKAGAKPLLVTSVAGQITVQGRAGIFGLPKTELSLVFTEPVAGTIDVDAAVLCPKNVALKIAHLPTLHLTSPTQDLDLRLKKTGSAFSLRIAGKDAEPVLLPGIAAVAQLTEGHGLENLLPSSLFDVIKGIAFNELRAGFDPVKKTVPLLAVDLEYVFTADSPAAWSLAPGIQVEELRFQLEVKNAVPPVGAARSATGAAFGTLAIGAVKVPLEFRSADAASEWWTARIREGEPVSLPNLRALLSKLLDANTLALIPAQFVDIPRIEIHALAFDFDPKKQSGTAQKRIKQLHFDLAAEGEWALVPGALATADNRLDFTLENLLDTANRKVAGSAKGVLKIGAVNVPLELRSPTAGNSLWSAGIQEGKTVVLPTLGELLAKLLESETLASIPSPIRNVPGITVNALVFEFDPQKDADPNKKTLQKLHFDIAADTDWELVPGFLATKNNRLDFTFENLTNAATRKIFGTAGSTLAVEGANFEFALAKTADNPQWAMTGKLAEGNALSLSQLAQRFLSGFSIPAELPDFSIDTAEFSLEMQSRKMVFRSGSSQGLEIVPGYGISKLGVGIERTPGQTASDPAAMSAALTGTILLDNIDLNLSAQLHQTAEAPGKNLIFIGAAATEKSIPIGKLISSLAKFGAIPVPESIDGATISNLKATYEVGKELTFGFTTLLEAGGKDVAADIQLRMTKTQSGQYEKAFEGLLTVGDSAGGDPLEFELSFVSEGGAESLYGTVRPGQLGALSLSGLFKKIVDIPEGLIPDVSVSLISAFITFTKGPSEVATSGSGGAQASTNVKTKGTLLFGVEVGADMSFGDGLPLVGPMLNGQSISVKTVLFSYATAEVALKKLQKINLRLPKGKPKLPEVNISGGIGMSFSMAFGKLHQYITLPIAEQAAPAAPGAPQPPPAAPQRESEGKWFAVNKRLGPLNIGRVGVNFKESVLSFGLDASLALGPLTLMLEEFTFGSPINRFEPRFDMRGFGIGYAAGPVEISGFFVRKPGNEFVGAALIKTPTLTLKAVGAFAMVRGEPSFYLYAYLGYPIGGPAFFFVEGLAAGFGFNRSVKVPTIEKVKPFPLVAIAVGEEPFLTVAKRMADGNFVPIDPGKIFLAVGVRFTTFKQLDSFLLIIATFGDSFRLDLLGLSKLTIPAPIPGQKTAMPLAEIELAIKGTFAPDEGFVGVQAQLTANSYILSRDCSLTGGFAFFTWFGNSPHAGDFVISLGGYHPDFKRPAHYPVVPRLGFNWNLSRQINVKGGMYFALTPSVVMAGGRLEATFQSGNLKAWFIFGADFIIGWKPFFYDAQVYMSMGVSYTFWFFGKRTVSFDVGARLHIWGPEFSGTAYIDLGIVEFTVSFGAGKSQAIQPISYDEFKKTFLPAKNVASVSAASGLLKEITQGEETVWIVNPKEFALHTDSVIPAKATPRLGVSAVQDFGIGTVGVNNSQLATIHTVTILKGSDDFTEEFLYEPLTKSYPAALWGDKLVADKNDQRRVIANALAGVKIKPKPPKDPDQMGFLDQDEFQFQTLTIGNAFAVGQGLSFQKTEDTPPVPGEHFVRNQLLGALGFDPERDFEIDENTDYGFAEPPVTGRYASAGLIPA